MTKAIFEPYQVLMNDLERLSNTLEDIHSENLTCHSGCSGCCQQDIGVFEVEAFHLRPAIAALPNKIKKQVKSQAKEVLSGQSQSCALLIDERCSIYQERPVICRTHGYPLHYAAEEEGEVFLDVCPLNFTKEGSIEAVVLEQTLPLDRLNLRLAAINHVYCRDELNNIDQANCRISLAELTLSNP